MGVTFVLACALALAVQPVSSSVPDAPGSTPVPSAPAKAREAQATVRCTVDVTGHLKDCSVLSENPPGPAFGADALKLTRFIRVKPPTRDGQPAEGFVILPIKFKLDDQAKPATPSSQAPTPAPSPPPSTEQP